MSSQRTRPHNEGSDVGPPNDVRREQTNILHTNPPHLSRKTSATHKHTHTYAQNHAHALPCSTCSRQFPAPRGSYFERTNYCTTAFILVGGFVQFVLFLVFHTDRSD